MSSTVWLVGERVVLKSRPGIICLDNEDGTWNVDFDDGGEMDVPGADLVKEEPLREAPCGARLVRNPDQEMKPEGWTRFVCFSDTHGMHDAIPRAHRPAGDVLLHAGDFTNTGELEQVASLAKWLEQYPAEHKVVIAGNHDITFQDDYYAKTGGARFHGEQRVDCQQVRPLLAPCCTYLEDSGIEVCGYSIYGSPWQPEFCDWAFNLPRGEACREKWALIPPAVDVLMTHGPPKGFGDQTAGGLRAGCEDLLAAIKERTISVSVSGHIHEGYGVRADDSTLFVNASTCTHDYRPSNPPIVFDLPPPAELREATGSARERRA